MIKIIRTFCLMIFLMAGIMKSHSQKETNVVIKEINKILDASSKLIIIDAENADIIINQSSDHNLNINLKLISKHPDIAIAKAQLDYLNYVIRNEKKEIFLHNYIEIKNNAKLKGSIKTIYTLNVPVNSRVNIENTIGEIRISNISASIELELKYGKLFLENCKGNLTANIHVGDLFINKCNLSCNISTMHVTSYFKNIKGSFQLNTNFGSINFDLNKNISKFVLSSNGTEINLNNKSCDEFNMHLISNQGSIYVNKCSIINPNNILIDTREDDSGKKEFRYENNTINQLIQITNKHSNIFIN